MATKPSGINDLSEFQALVDSGWEVGYESAYGDKEQEIVRQKEVVDRLKKFVDNIERCERITVSLGDEIYTFRRKQ